MILEQVHREYLDVGQQHNLAMFALPDTWRGNQERIGQSTFRGYKVNLDNAQFLATISDSYGASAAPIFIGGQIGPRGDAYSPREALSSAAAERFHTPKLKHWRKLKWIFFMRQHHPRCQKRRELRNLVDRTDRSDLSIFQIGLRFIERCLT